MGSCGDFDYEHNRLLAGLGLGHITNCRGTFYSHTFSLGVSLAGKSLVAWLGVHINGTSRIFLALPPHTWLSHRLPFDIVTSQFEVHAIQPPLILADYNFCIVVFTQ
jgi:hypothetical protein